MIQNYPVFAVRILQGSGLWLQAALATSCALIHATRRAPARDQFRTSVCGPAAASGHHSYAPRPGTPSVLCDSTLVKVEWEC